MYASKNQYYLLESSTPHVILSMTWLEIDYLRGSKLARYVTTRMNDIIRLQSIRFEAHPTLSHYLNLPCLRFPHPFCLKVKLSSLIARNFIILYRPTVDTCVEQWQAVSIKGLHGF